jgi:hypothetical protein
MKPGRAAAGPSTPWLISEDDGLGVEKVSAPVVLYDREA